MLSTMFDWLPDWSGKAVAGVLGLFAVIRFLVVYYTAREMRRNLDLLKDYCNQFRSSAQAPLAYDEKWLNSVASMTAMQLIQRHIPERQEDGALQAQLQEWVYRALLSGVHGYARQCQGDIRPSSLPKGDTCDVAPALTS